MILFYNKKDGKVFATIEGRVHDQRAMKCSIANGIPRKDVGRYIIGWEETKKTKDVIRTVEQLVEVKKNLFSKQVQKVKVKEQIKIEHNLNKFKILQKFEDKTPFSPLRDVLIIKNKLVIKK